MNSKCPCYNEDAANQNGAEKAARKVKRTALGAAVAQWKIAEERRKARNITQHEVYSAAVKAWEVGRDKAKAEKQRSKVKKPKLAGIEKPIPRPKKVTQDSEEEEEEEEEAGDEDSDS